jgi:hypothetical protein
MFIFIVPNCHLLSVRCGVFFVRTRQSGLPGTRLAQFAHRQAALDHATALCAFPLRHEPYVESSVARNKLPSDSGLKKMRNAQR